MDWSRSTPRVLNCANEAVETVRTSLLGIYTWLCADCVEKLERNGTIVRNPKRRR